MKTKYKYIHFKALPVSEGMTIKGQTHIWHCFANKDKTTLGNFHYNFQWKQWEFWPNYSTAFTNDCLADIIDFMKQLKP